MRSVLIADETIERIQALGPPAVPSDVTTIQGRVNMILRDWLEIDGFLAGSAVRKLVDFAEAEREATGKAVQGAEEVPR